jgi:hypothetical protein
VHFCGLGEGYHLSDPIEELLVFGRGGSSVWHGRFYSFKVAVDSGVNHEMADGCSAGSETPKRKS